MTTMDSLNDSLNIIPQETENPSPYIAPENTSSVGASLRLRENQKIHEYLLTQTSKTWAEAQAEAERLGGNLVTINSSAEELWIQQTFGTRERFWIGINDAKIEGQFEWASGEPMSYTNWSVGEPNDALGQQDYGVINSGTAYRWDDDLGTARYRGIIEIVRDSVTNESQLLSLNSQTTYYISPTGNDSNNGLSPTTAWRTIERVNQIDFAEAATILFEGDKVFDGSLNFNAADNRPEGEIIHISSYGNGRAIIRSGVKPGLKAFNTDQIKISNLKFEGVLQGNSSNGIDFYTNLPASSSRLDEIEIDNVEVSGFLNGILIGAFGNTKGFQNIAITNSSIHDNRRDGVKLYRESGQSSTAYAHQDVYIAGNKVFNNLGDLTLTNENSGSGIVLGSVEKALVEYNSAYQNGGQNGNSDGGPVGIWAWDSSRILMQFNQSYRNQTRNEFDGAGFDFDGGVTNSVMQNNYSYDNDGAGFLLGQYLGAKPSFNNVIRDNVSKNDARKNNYGGITLFQAPDTYLGEVYIYQNLISMQESPSLSYTFKLIDWNRELKDIWVFENTFEASSKARLTNVESSPGLQFINNSYTS